MNKLTTIFLKVILIAATLVSSTASLWAQDGSTYICHAIGIEGFETQHAQAGAYKGKTTKVLREMRVYIAVKGDNLYIDSNFIPPGKNFDHPTKIRTSEEVFDLQALSKFLVDDRGVVESEQTFRKAFEEDVRFFVDHKVFQHPKYKNLSFSGAQHVQLIGTDRAPLPTRVIPVANGGERVVEVGPSLFVRASEPDISKLILQLKSKPFNKHDVGILSLVTNRATNEAIQIKIESNSIGHRRKICAGRWPPIVIARSSQWDM